MRKIIVLFITFFCLIIVHCATYQELQPEGEHVKVLTHSEAPKTAKFIKNIESIFNSNQISAINDMKNKAGKAGANLVVIDNITYRDDDYGYCAVGRAYLIENEKE